MFPLSAKLDEDIPITITDLNYTQFLSPHLGFFFGKIDTLDGDPNEFASGRGTSQFMNANFVFNPALALRLPYSTLAAGIVWMPIPPSSKGGITVSSTVLNTQDSSTTSGFDDFDEGTSWTTEVDFQYRLGHLPGGMNVGSIYSFNQDFARLNSRLVLQPGEGLVVPKENSTWAVYWSTWQYLYTEEPSNLPIDVLNGEPDLQGIGFFIRFGFADRETNPLLWAVSGGIGGRGVVPFRDNDTFGIGYYYNSGQSGILLGILGVAMNTEDVQPSRLTRATQKIHDLLKQRAGAKTSLIAYAGTAHVVMPETSDSTIIDAFAQALDPKIMPKAGDAAADALRLADQTLAGTGSGSILWITDSIAPEQAASLVAWRKSSNTPVRLLPPLLPGPELDALLSRARVSMLAWYGSRRTMPT